MTRSALITGASRGIGLGIARKLAERGYGLTIAGRDQATLDAAASLIRAAGSPQVVSCPGDVSDLGDLANLAETHRGQFSTMDVLILNAGSGTAGPIASTSTKQFDRAINVNLRGPLALVRESLPMLRAAASKNPARGAKVVAVSSITGVYAEPGLSVYGASKAGLLSFIETLNAEESGAGVVATALAPGFVDTDMAAWKHDMIQPDSMIPVEDIVTLVDAIVSLSSRTMVSRMTVARSSSDGYRA